MAIPRQLRYSKTPESFWGSNIFKSKLYSEIQILVRGSKVYFNIQVQYQGPIGLPEPH